MIFFKSYRSTLTILSDMSFKFKFFSKWKFGLDLKVLHKNEELNWVFEINSKIIFIWLKWYNVIKIWLLS